MKPIIKKNVLIACLLIILSYGFYRFVLPYLQYNSIDHNILDIVAIIGLPVSVLVLLVVLIVFLIKRKKVTPTGKTKYLISVLWLLTACVIFVISLIFTVTYDDAKAFGDYLISESTVYNQYGNKVKEFDSDYIVELSYGKEIISPYRTITLYDDNYFLAYENAFGYTFDNVEYEGNFYTFPYSFYYSIQLIVYDKNLNKVGMLDHFMFSVKYNPDNDSYDVAEANLMNDYEIRHVNVTPKIKYDGEFHLATDYSVSKRIEFYLDVLSFEINERIKPYKDYSDCDIHQALEDFLFMTENED